MEHTPYSQNILLDTSMVDIHGCWQPGAIFRAMQEASGVHAEGWGLGRQPLMDCGIAWVLTRAAMRMEEYPVYGQTVTVSTWPGKTRHGFFPRYYTFFVDGKQIGCATALYVLMDIEQRKMADPARLPGQLPEYDIPAPMPAPGVIALPAGEPEVNLHPVRYTDLDFNGHVNNTRYVDWYMDCIPLQEHREMELEQITVHYLQEIRPGETVDLLLHREDNVAVLRGMAEGQQRFLLKGVWRKRQ